MMSNELSLINSTGGCGLAVLYIPLPNVSLQILIIAGSHQSQVNFHREHL